MSVNIFSLLWLDMVGRYAQTRYYLLSFNTRQIDYGNTMDIEAVIIANSELSAVGTDITR